MKRLFSLMLALAMVLSAVPFGALAEENVQTAITEETAPTEAAATEPVVAEELPAAEAEVMLADGNISSGTPDGEPPVLTGMTLSVTTVTAPGEIEVTVSATDDVSGVSDISVSFYCEETKRSIGAGLSRTYWDESTREDILYADGMFHGTIEIDQYLEPGTFVLDYIFANDNAGNNIAYVADYPNVDWAGAEEAPIPDFIMQREIRVVDSSIPDGTPPEITELTLSSNTMTAPGEIEVIVSATDDVSGVSDVSVSFYCEETKRSIGAGLSRTYWDKTTWEDIPYADGKFHGTIEIDQYLESGTFVLDYIFANDNAGNNIAYVADYPNVDWGGAEEAPIPDHITQREIYITDSGTPDGTPPEITELTLMATTMTAPGKIEVVVSATDDVSGVSDVSVSFYCEETKRSIGAGLSRTYWDKTTWEDIPYADGKFHGTIEIDQYLESGTFVLDYIFANDNAGNNIAYVADYPNVDWGGAEEAPIPDCVTQREINVLNAIPDVTTSVAKPEFAEQVKDAADNAYIVADYSGETTMEEEVFEAIAGTDKTLDLVSEGITWRFNGEDITEEIKPIDLNVQITKAEEETSSSGQEIQDKLDETPAVVMKFAENGQLPGKATIQVKVDYAMREYLGSDQKLCVYYYNNQTGQLELVAENLTVLNDTYVEFTITHCSYYILTTKLGTDTEPKPEVNDVHWKLENGTLTIYGTGKMDDYERIDVRVDVDGRMEIKMYGETPWYTRADEITAIVVDEGITHVGEFSFFGLDKVTSAKLPSTLKTIGAHSFQNNKALTAIDLPNKLEYVGPYAFSGCMGINELTLPSSLLKLGGWSFDCDIEKLYIDSIEYWLNVEFEPGESWVYSPANPMCSGKCQLYVDGVLTTDVVIPEGTTEIPMYRFYRLKSLKSITIPDSVTYIGEGAFLGCDGLKEVTIPEGVTSIGNEAFYYCNGLITVTIPDSVETIGTMAFRACSSLTTLNIGSGITAIGAEAFDLCKNLTDVYYNGTEEMWNRIDIGEENESLINATIHFFEPEHVHSYTPEVTDPTCKLDGYITYTCKCGDSYVEDGAAALGHSSDAYTMNTVPTLEAEGALAGTCNRCGESLKVVLPKLNRQDYTLEVLVEPTKESEGFGKYTWNVAEYGEFTFEAAISNVILGDVNEDDKVTILDLMRLANFFAKGAEINETNADVNGDGRVTILDLMRLANFFAGKAQLG